MRATSFRPPNAQNAKVFFINDCRDHNAQAIQIGEWARYSNVDPHPTFVGINHELEASFNMVNILKTFRHGKRGGIAVNGAPRSGTVKNGIDFGYFRHDEAWVVTTTGPTTLFLPCFLGVTKDIRVLDTEKTVDFLIEQGFISPDDRDDIIQSQFRSSVFSPAVLAYLLEHGEIPHTLQPIVPGEDALWEKDGGMFGRVCWIDNFGNLKLSTPSREFDSLAPGTTVPTEIVSGGFCAVLPYYPLLSMVPDGRMAITRGSSGVGKYRLLEVVIKGGRAVDVLKFKVGDRVLQS
ncbi:MAG: hypothetical protein AAB767_02045 [Patescibacteria group bacterium]